MDLYAPAHNSSPRFLFPSNPVFSSTPGFFRQVLTTGFCSQQKTPASKKNPGWTGGLPGLSPAKGLW
jgi:hypothetical protein